jgi:hypothetical protein
LSLDFKEGTLFWSPRGPQCPGNLETKLHPPNHSSILESTQSHVLHKNAYLALHDLFGSAKIDAIIYMTLVVEFTWMTYTMMTWGSPITYVFRVFLVGSGSDRVLLFEARHAFMFMHGMIHNVLGF